MVVLVSGTSAAGAGELGLNVFGASAHVDRGAGYNEFNPGLGLHYVFARSAREWEFFADGGSYYDSMRHWARYAGAGAYYRFAPLWKAGALVGYAYSRSYNHAEPFVAVLPLVAYELRGWTLNAALLPAPESSSRVAGVAVFATLPLTRND